MRVVNERRCVVAGRALIPVTEALVHILADGQQNRGTLLVTGDHHME